jgi:hypothetical protein
MTNNTGFSNQLGDVKDMAQLACIRATLARQTPPSDIPLGDTPEYLAAARSLTNILKGLRHYLQLVAKNSATELGLQIELGECYGALGSLNRDAGKFALAIDNYADGRRCELRVQQIGGPSNSYCMVQELVTRLLDTERPSSALLLALVQARKTVLLQIHSGRARDPWAYADLGLLTQLVCPEQAAVVWDQLDAFQPFKFLYDALYHVLKMLHVALAPTLAPETARAWQKTLKRFASATRSPSPLAMTAP